MHKEQALLLPDEVASILRVDAVLLEQLVASGKIEAIRVGDQFRFTQDALRAFLHNASTMPNAAPAHRRVVHYSTAGAGPNRAQGEHQALPTADDFREALDSKFEDAERSGLTSLTIRAGNLHAELGGYPSTNHRMPVCCAVMREMMKDGDRVVAQPPSGKGASLEIAYRLPR